MSDPENDLQYRIASLSVRPGDLVIVKSNRILSMEQMGRMMAAMAAVLPAGQKFIVLDASIDISVLRTDHTVADMPAGQTLQ